MAAVFAVSHLVTTPREQLGISLKQLLDAVEAKRLDEVRGLIDPQAMTRFMDEELTREQVIARIESVEFDDIILIGSSALLDPQQGYGSTGLRVNVKGTVADYPGTNVSEWAIRWRYEKEADRWVAVRLECVKFGADALFHRGQ